MIRFLRAFLALALLVASPAPVLAQMSFSSPATTTVVHPGYVPNNWYAPVPWLSGSVGGAITASNIRLLPFTLAKPIKVQALAARVATVSAGGNFQVAIYAHNAATGRPTGPALASTASLSTASAAAVSGTVTAVTLQPGTYWMAVNQDNSTAAFVTVNPGSIDAAYLTGSATLTNITTGAQFGPCLSVSQTFGTWPDLTSASFTEVFSSANAIVFMQAA